MAIDLKNFEPSSDVWFYRAAIDNSKWENGVYDGDSIALSVDVGFGFSGKHRFRLLGVDTPELRGSEREQGLAAKADTVDWILQAISIDDPWPLIVRTEKADSFGRYLAEVWAKSDFGIGDGQEPMSLNKWLVEVKGWPKWQK